MCSQSFFYSGVSHLYNVCILINIDETSIHVHDTYLFYATRIQAMVKADNFESNVSNRTTPMFNEMGMIG